MAHPRSPELEDRTIDVISNSPRDSWATNHSRIGILEADIAIAIRIESQTAQHPGNISMKWGMPPTAMVWLIEPNRQRNKFF
jgi:hypothetical protein